MALAPDFHILIYEGTGSRPLEAGRRFEICAGLLDLGYSVSRSGAGARLGAGQEKLVVLAEFANGTAPELEDAAGGVSLSALDIAGLDGAAVTALVERSRAGKPMNQPGLWKPWFPVIDYSRCTNCMQCLSFCLFDVYGVSKEGKLQVQNNDNCKTNCPACSRVCPEVAIMFPKYSSGPINGEPVSDSDVKREKMKVDISALLGGDLYARLRERSDAAKSRFSKERDASKALAERKKCLTKLMDDGMIPADVLASLPGPEEIQRRAAAAAEKAGAALAAAAAAN
ncbi:MAG: ferredoxin family protein [Verrucomicrobiaceae bacterium]|nr:MAG: ferredoxin family protein [Verrucomicrobiaceae bacterium]